MREKFPPDSSGVVSDYDALTMIYNYLVNVLDVRCSRLPRITIGKHDLPHNATVGTGISPAL